MAVANIFFPVSRSVFILLLRANVMQLALLNAGHKQCIYATIKITCMTNYWVHAATSIFVWQLGSDFACVHADAGAFCIRE
jgi:hypothetical protein